MTAKVFHLANVFLAALAVRHSAGEDLMLSVNEHARSQLPSSWADYFGTHYASSPEGCG